MQGFNSYIPTRKTSPCENCGDLKGKCRTVRNNENLILCMNVSCQSDILNSSWTFGGTTDNGGWGKVFTSSRKELTDEERREYAIAKAKRESDDKRHQQSIIDSIESIDRRHEGFVGKIDAIKKDNKPVLSQSHRESVRKRGLTDKDIEIMQLFSSNAGLHIPIQTFNGKWAGNQYKASNNKYYWGEGRDRNYLKETGQLPLAFWGERVNPKKILLVEGIGFKVYITSLRFPDCLVIGAAGGLFAQSGKQLQDAIDRFPCASIVLMPDADPFNPRKRNVMSAYTSAMMYLDSIGRTMKVAWWGQLIKSVGDIDEVDPSTPIECISWDEFVAKQSIRSKLITYVTRTWRRLLTPVNRNIETIKVDKSSIDYIYDGGRRETYEYGDEPVIEYDVSGYEQALIRSVDAGNKITLDMSAAGKGKSTLAAQLINFGDKFTKIIYVSPTARNPSTLEAERYFDLMPAKVETYWVSKTLSTPNGNPIVRTSKPSTNIEGWEEQVGNCHFASEQLIVSQSGYDREDNNPVCSKCPYLKDCQTGNSTEKGREYGYYFELKKAMTQHRLRVHPAQLPIFLAEDLSKTLVIMDDCKITNHKELQASKDLMQSTFGKIAMADRDLFDRLKPLLDGIVNLLGVKSHNGYDHSDILNAIGDIDSESLDSDTSLVMEILQPKLWDLKIGDNNSTNLHNLKQYGMTFADNRLDINDLQPNWLVWMLEVFSGKTQGVLRLKIDKISIKREDKTHRQVIDKSAHILMLDATQSRGFMALETGVSEDKIMTISQEPPQYPNLHIHQVHGAGTPNKGRKSDNYDALDVAVAKLHGKVSVFDKKGMGKDGNRAVHFSDSRGSNKFELDNAIVSIGMLCLNMGEVADMYSILTGTIVSASSSDEGFKKYLRHLNAAEEIQMIGRLRASQRVNEELHVYVVADTPNYPLAEVIAAYPGATIHHDEMIDICPEAANKTARNKLAVMRLLSERPGVNQRELADGVGLSESTISTMMKPFGGFKKTLEKLLSISIAFQKFQNSALTNWEELIPTDVVDYTIKVIDNGNEPLATALELEQVCAHLHTDDITALFGCIGKSRAVIAHDLMHQLQVYRDNEHILKMKLADTGDTVDDLVEGLEYVVKYTDVVALDALRDKHWDDKDSMQLAASKLSKQDRDHLGDMVRLANKSRELRKSTVVA